jgi:hypothetical protein
MRFTFTMSQAVSTLTPYAVRKKSPRLRELGIYLLPDGREYVVSTLYSDGCSIYPVHSWESYGNAEYWADKDGRLLRRGIPSRWSVSDMKDTGRTSAYPKPIIR